METAVVYFSVAVKNAFHENTRLNVRHMSDEIKITNVYNHCNYVHVDIH